MLPPQIEDLSHLVLPGLRAAGGKVEVSNGVARAYPAV
jgi:hypothetical protein